MIVERYGGMILATRGGPGPAGRRSLHGRERSSRSPSTCPSRSSRRTPSAVLARLLAWRGDLRAAATQARLWQAAERLVPPRGAGQVQPGAHGPGGPGLHPAVAELPALPAGLLCSARRLGLQDALPVIDPQAATPGRFRGLCPGGSRGPAADRAARAKGLWAGFWEFPTINLEGADPAGRSFGEPVGLAEGVERLTGIRAEIGPRAQEAELLGDQAPGRAAGPPGDGPCPDESSPARDSTAARWVEPAALSSSPSARPPGAWRPGSDQDPPSIGLALRRRSRSTAASMVRHRPAEFRPSGLARSRDVL